MEDLSHQERKYRAVYGPLPRAAYDQWLSSLNSAELAKVRAMEAKTAAIENAQPPEQATAAGLGVINRKVKQEPHAKKAEVKRDAAGTISIDIVDNENPLHALFTKEDLEDMGFLNQTDQYNERVKGLSAFFSHCFRDRAKTGCNLKDAFIRFLVVVKTVREDCLDGMSLDELADVLGTTKQNLSLENRYLREMFGMRSRNSKRDPSVYVENSLEWKAERRAKAKAEKRKATQAAYHQKRRAYILARKRERYALKKAQERSPFSSTPADSAKSERVTRNE
jgi:hypothetical protein